MEAFIYKYTYIFIISTYSYLNITKYDDGFIFSSIDEFC